jgi:hypothetical protein
VTAAEALADKWLIYRVAGEAQVDPSTVKWALQGRKGKGSAYERTMKCLGAAGVKLSTIPQPETDAASMPNRKKSR